MKNLVILHNLGVQMHACRGCCGLSAHTCLKFSLNVLKNTFLSKTPSTSGACISRKKAFKNKQRMHVLSFNASLLDFGTDCPDGKYILPVHSLQYNSAKHGFEVCKHSWAESRCACAAWLAFHAHHASNSFERPLA